MLLRPTTTASLPRVSTPLLNEQFHCAGGRARDEAVALPDQELADVHGMEPIEVLLGADPSDDLVADM